MAVFAIYVVYYAANILYDAFLKQSKTNTGEEEEIISIGEEEEIPHKVVDGVSPTFTTNVTLRLYFHRNIHKLNL